MQITSAESFILDVPVGRTMADSQRQVDILEFVGVNLASNAGITGCGYTVTVGAGGSVIREALDTLFCPAIIGRDPADVRQIWSDLDKGPARWIGRAGATTMAQAAIDIALWDMLAKAAEEPLYRLLGAARPKPVPIYNTHGGWLNYSEKELCEEASALVDGGYRAVKIKVGRETLREDASRIAAVRKTIGDDILLMVDANQAWDKLTALEAGRLFDDFGLGWLEEPLHPDDVAGHAELRRKVSVPIALGEHVYSTYAFEQFIAAKAVDVIQVDVCRVGGITPWLEVAHLAKAAGLRICPHAGDLMQVHQHMVKAVSNSWMLEVIPIWEQGPFVHQIQLAEGFCANPTAPGASTDFTDQAMARFRRA